jgi:2-oxoglutarate ferredoxin oxidoreductase subunit delta
MKYWRKPLDLEKHKVPRGVVHVIDERCKGCAICVEFCPKAVLALSDIYNAKGYHPPRPVKPEACVDCDLCELLCPEFAIYTVPVDGKATEAKPAPKDREAKEVASHA